ncbi:extensin-like domain-containing protein [Mycoplana dimorpha]|uniref:Extensin-like C-terminal domain-containing protein n=1 Tax=Mycoplana dimorpha TaxID=28320 RepID=A0A2T5B894_MYCDI|nr:hypothetical protein C7449_104283 [Mycoplana dimorpha]
MGTACFFSRRMPRALLAAVFVAGCSGDLTPPVGIDGDNTVNAITPARAIGAEGAAAYPTETMPVTSAGDGYAVVPGTSRQLPIIDSDAALGANGAARASMAGGTLQIPDDGVNMDAGLGVGAAHGSGQQPIQGLAEAQAEEIAEGNATQVMVDGIGTDTPRQLGQPLPVPMSQAGGEIGLRAPASGSKPAGQDQQVAFIPRFTDPMAVPESHGGMPAAEKACRQRLQRLGVTYRDVPAFSSGRSCGIAYPIELQALSGGIQIKPAARVNCQITEAFAKWVKNELAPSARLRYLSGVRSIHQMSSYSCRTMNSQRGAAMSEHARGNAIDVGKIVLNSGKEILVRRKGFFAFREKGLLKAVRTDSCKYFTTVLGPGSDRFHTDHFHFDLRMRKSGYRHCSL